MLVKKILLKLFDELIEAIFNDKSVSNSDDNGSVNESVNESENENENDNVSENENESVDKIDDNDVSVNKDDNNNESESESGDEQYYKIKQLNNYFRTIDETKLFEEQIEILKKRDFLVEYWYEGYYHDNKELNLKAAYLLNDVDKYLFKEIFDHTFAALTDKLINTTNKEENKIIINDIKKNRDKIYEQDEFGNNIIQPNYKRADLLDAVKIILELNAILSLDGDDHD